MNISCFEHVAFRLNPHFVGFSCKSSCLFWSSIKFLGMVLFVTDMILSLVVITYSFVSDMVGLRKSFVKTLCLWLILHSNVILEIVWQSQMNIAWLLLEVLLIREGHLSFASYLSFLYEELMTLLVLWLDNFFFSRCFCLFSHFLFFD